MTFTEGQVDALIALLYVIVIGGGVAGFIWSGVYPEAAHDIVGKCVGYCYDLAKMFLNIFHRSINSWNTIIDIIKRKMGL